MNADWLSEPPYVIKQYKNPIHNSTKMKPIEASKKIKNQYLTISKTRDRNVYQKIQREQLVRTADIKRFFSKGDSTNCSHKLYTVAEIKHDTIPSYRIDFLTGRYYEVLLRPTNLTLDQNNQVMKTLKLIQQNKK